MLAHLTALSTLVIAMSTAGLGHVVGLLVPLAMYLYFASRSRYVAFHALQATVFQAVFGIVYLIITALVGAAVAAAWIVSGVLTVVLVGFLLMPVALGLSLLASVELVALPVLGLYYALRGAYLTSQGRDFDYPWVGRLTRHSMGA